MLQDFQFGILKILMEIDPWPHFDEMFPGFWLLIQFDLKIRSRLDQIGIYKSYNDRSGVFLFQFKFYFLGHMLTCQFF